jgi:predicted homoserine dehydrogenase-like protein
VRIRVLCGRNTQKCVDAYRVAGVAAEKIKVCETYEEGVKAFQNGDCLVFSNTILAMRMPFDVVIEGTGKPEAAAAHVLAAIENGKHVIMVTKESDSVAGSLFARKAKEKGAIYSLVEGDQPSLLIGLCTWAKTAGLTILSIGKSSEYDFIYDPKAKTMSVQGKIIPVPDFDSVWDLGSNFAETLKKRSSMLSMIKQRAVPDLTEMGIVLNHLDGFQPDISTFHCPIARAVEIPDLMCASSEGGIFNGSGRIDVVNLLRRNDEQSLEGGVHLVVACDDEETWEVLKEKGVPLSRNGKTALIYYPAHYLGLEAIFSVLSVGLLGMPTGSVDPRPRFDVVARSTTAIKKGTSFEAQGHHREIAGLEAIMLPAEAISRKHQIPFYLCDMTTLKRDIEPGALITADMLETDGSPLLWTLRAEQDELFF